MNTVNQWRIQDFPQGGAPTPKIAIIFHIFAENCMKMKEFGPPGGARVPGAPLGSANAVCDKVGVICKVWQPISMNTYIKGYVFHSLTPEP